MCVGLDPHWTELRSPDVGAAKDFCYRLIEATLDIAAAYKPNIAFFEAFGPEGLLILQQVISIIPNTIPVILDAKRGDIASTAEAYVRSVFQQLGAQAVTINPYLGYDAVEPFLADPDHGVFLLCKTSNPGARDLQDLWVTGSSTNHTEQKRLRLYEKVAILAGQWNSRDNLGLVVGATQPEAIERVRLLAPDMWILAPGVGIQGGDLQAAMQAGLRSDGMGMLVPMSRGISQSPNPKQTAEDTRLIINQQRIELSGQTKRPQAFAEDSSQNDDFVLLADGLLEAGCIKFGQFTLKSGLVSPIYIDLRLLGSFPELLKLVARLLLPILDCLSFERIAGLPYAALPIATAVSLQGGWPMIYPRKETKSYGTKAEIEGIFHEGEHVVIIDDLATTGESKFESIEKLTSVGLKVTDIVVLIDRQSGAAEALDSAGFKLHSVTTLSELLDHYEQTKAVTAEQVDVVKKFLGAG